MLHKRGDAPLVGVCRIELPRGLLGQILQFDPVARSFLTDRCRRQIDGDSDVVAVGRQRLQIG